MSESSYDVVICGGGLVGATLALSLSTLPLSIGLIDPGPVHNTQRVTDDRTFTLALSSQRALTTLGAWQHVPAEAFEPITHIHISDSRGHFGFTHIHATEIGVPALGYVTENKGLLQALYTALANTTVHIHQGRFQAYRDKGDAAVVHIDTANGPTYITSRLLVGADGTFSAVREAAGLPTQRRNYDREALVVNCQVSAPQRGTAFERFGKEGPIAALPRGGASYTIVISQHDARMLQEIELPSFLNTLHTLFGNRLGQFMDAGQRLRFPLALIKTTQPTKNRVVVIGNAAHTLHPVAGQGFNLGVRDVATLADHIAHHLRLGRDFGSEQSLKHYATQRKADTADTIAFTDGLIRAFNPSFLPLIVARNLALTAIDGCLPLKRALATRSMGLKGPLPRLLRGLNP